MKKLPLILLLLTILAKVNAEDFEKHLLDTSDHATAIIVIDMFQSPQSDLPGFSETSSNIQSAVSAVHQQGGLVVCIIESSSEIIEKISMMICHP